MVLQMKRVGVLCDPAVPGGIGTFGAVQAFAGSTGVDVIPIDVRDRAVMERAFAALAQIPSRSLSLRILMRLRGLTFGTAADAGTRTQFH